MGDVQGNVDCKMPEKEDNEYKFRNLERRIKELEKTVRVLTVLCDHYAKVSELKVERFMDGITIISPKF